MIHVMQDEFQIYDMPTILNCEYIFNIIEDRNLKSEKIFINDIFHKELDSIKLNNRRYIAADTSYPCILLNDLSNPENKKYRMIDGRHRLLKTLLQGKNFINGYVLSFADVEPFIEDTSKYSHIF